MQCHLGGQHLFRPHQACFGGQRFSQKSCDPVPTRIVLHSSFGLQHWRPQPLSSSLQQSLWLKFAQYSPGLQQLPTPQVFLQTHGGSP